MNFVVVTNY